MIVFVPFWGWFPSDEHENMFGQIESTCFGASLPFLRMLFIYSQMKGVTEMQMNLNVAMDVDNSQQLICVLLNTHLECLGTFWNFASCLGQGAVSERSSSQKYEEMSHNTGVCVWPTHGVILYKSPNIFYICSQHYNNQSFNFLSFHLLNLGRWKVTSYLVHALIVSAELMVCLTELDTWQVFPLLWPQKKVKSWVSSHTHIPLVGAAGFSSAQTPCGLNMLLKRKWQWGC